MRKYIAVVLLLCAGQAAASEALHFSGFGTLGVAFNQNNEADYTTNQEQPTGVGASDNRDYGLDSLFGFQVETALRDDVMATVQMQSRRMSDGSTTPYFEWANIQFRPSADWSVRLGRVVTPMFLSSESRAIGYSRAALRLSPELYQVNPVSYLDGAGVTWTTEADDVLYTTNVTAGRLQQRFATFLSPVDIDIQGGLFSVSAETGGHLVRLGYSAFMVDISNPIIEQIEGMIATLADAGIAEAAVVQENIFSQDIKGIFYHAGYQYDQGNYHLESEYIIRNVDSFLIQSVDALQVLASYKMGPITPFVRYAQCDVRVRREDAPFVDASGYDQPLPAFADVANGYTDDLKTLDERSAWTTGLRWDFQDNYAVKVQLDRVSKPAGLSGLFINSSDDFNARHRVVHVLAFALDFVF